MTRRITPAGCLLTPAGCLPAVVLSLLLAGLPATTAEAQTFIAPLAGFDFSGDSACPAISECEDRRLNAGVAFGRMGNVFGAETELAYARGFFGETPGGSSSLFTWMGNLMVIPNLGPLRPYGTVGLGIMRPRVDLNAVSILEAQNLFGWNLGGGAMLLLGQHVGLRGDIRYFHSFEEMPVVNIALGGERLDFGRASAGVVFKF